MWISRGCNERFGTKSVQDIGSIGLKSTYLDHLQRDSDYETSLGLTLGSEPTLIPHPPRDPSKPLQRWNLWIDSLTIHFDLFLSGLPLNSTEAGKFKSYIAMTPQSWGSGCDLGFTNQRCSLKH